MTTSRARTLLFATGVCVVCASFVSSATVLLGDRQERNALLDRRRNVLEAAGLTAAGERLPADEVDRRFEAIESVVVDLTTGRELPDVDAASVAPDREAMDEATSRPAPPNAAQVRRLPNRTLVYEVRDEAGDLRMIVLPIEGKGLWSTLRGFLSLDADLVTIRGITFHSHLETPGLGGEIDDPGWKAQWIGRRAFGPSGEVRIEVIKGAAGPPEDDPYRVDGLSGATITARGVSHLVRFWLGEHGYGRYLSQLSASGAPSSPTTEVAPGV